MSAETATVELEHALQQLNEGHTVLVSPTEHGLSSVELFELADQIREQHQAGVEIVWRPNGTLAYEPWGLHRRTAADL
jgi:hypothetical protein